MFLLYVSSIVWILSSTAVFSKFIYRAPSKDSYSGNWWCCLKHYQTFERIKFVIISSYIMGGHITGKQVVENNCVSVKYIRNDFVILGLPEIFTEFLNNPQIFK